MGRRLQKLKMIGMEELIRSWKERWRTVQSLQERMALRKMQAKDSLMSLKASTSCLNSDRSSRWLEQGSFPGPQTQMPVLMLTQRQIPELMTLELKQVQTLRLAQMRLVEIPVVASKRLAPKRLAQTPRQRQMGGLVS